MPRKPRKTNGWREGSDPIQRWLRIATTVICLVVFVYLSLTDGRNDSILVIALALGAALVLLGYEGVVRLPLISSHDDDDDEGP